ncbi:hypothetical protein [Cellulophaga sp. BC115SP]|uniref:hypothetical protein n=1 Tax=Cellulophaga sp. BC115SP TaxID=2683263 RepID=UPI0014130B8A|nr:hypothetical protein [Cellulophaga sp. BC115SP]NBB28684.1 hypothetical protein [Cellulophaga sp. BC115SP]
MIKYKKPKGYPSGLKNIFNALGSKLQALSKSFTYSEKYFLTFSLWHKVYSLMQVKLLLT